MVLYCGTVQASCDKCNESKVQNIVSREFSAQPQYNVAVNDLAYVRVGTSWNYICVLVDLFNREIIGYSAGKNKNVVLVSKESPFSSLKPLYLSFFPF